MRYPLFFLMFLTLLGCKEDVIDTGVEIIYIDLDKLGEDPDPLPNLEIESIVHLETNESSLVGNVDRIEWYDGNIYLLDIHKSGALFAFSEMGEFIDRTKYGRGPGEVIKPYALYLDKDSNLIYLWDQSLELITKYSSKLEYLGQEKFNHTLTNFAILEDGRTLVNSHYYMDFMYKIYGPDNETVEQKFIPDINYPYSYRIFRSISKNNRLLIIAPFQYDIYELEDNTLSIEYQVDFGKYMLSKDIIEQNGLSELFALFSEGKRVSSLNDISEGESFLSFRVYFKSEALDFAYSFKDQKPYLINEYVGKNMLPACTVRGITEDDLFYAVVEPEDLDNFQKETGKILIEGEIDPESNSYIITFKLGELVKN